MVHNHTRSPTSAPATCRDDRIASPEHDQPFYVVKILPTLAIRLGFFALRECRIVSFQPSRRPMQYPNPRRPLGSRSSGVGGLAGGGGCRRHRAELGECRGRGLAPLWQKWVLWRPYRR